MIVDIMNNLNTLNKVIEDNIWAIDMDYGEYIKRDDAIMIVDSMIKILDELKSGESSKKLNTLLDFMKTFPDVMDFRKQTILVCLESCKDANV